VLTKEYKKIKDFRLFDKLLPVSIVSLLSFIIMVTGRPAIGEPRTVYIGDEVLVYFTCRLKDGSIVMTTDAALAEDKNESKAGIFLPLKEYGPVTMTAGSGRKGPDYGKIKTIENEILESLSLVIVGMEEGSHGVFEVGSQIMPDLTEEDRFLRLSRIRRQSKSIKVHPETFKKAHGKEPVLGDIIISEDYTGLSMEVLSVTDDEVQVNVSMKEGMKMDLPLGTGTVYDAGDHYEIVIDMHIGKLLRSGVIVGRVIDIEGEMLTIDYGHPFGHETLSCDVTVVEISTNE
jgi:FKBP-type peptidyl-prolyl cis-trans isomerase 2